MIFGEERKENGGGERREGSSGVFLQNWAKWEKDDQRGFKRGPKSVCAYTRWRFLMKTPPHEGAYLELS